MLVGTNFGSHIERKWPLASTPKGEVLIEIQPHHQTNITLSQRNKLRRGRPQPT
jgi:hypothetical protein